MALLDIKNQNLMQVIRKVHDVVENDDLEKQRQSQDYFGTLFSNRKDIQMKDEDIDGMHAEWVRVERIHSSKNVILYCHGGGYATGSSLYARSLTTKLATGTMMDVLCFDYRLAPEHPYPAALEDAVKAWDHLMYLGYGADEVVVAGDSAGGNLALALTLKLRMQGRKLPRALVLMSPWTDLTAAGKSYQTKREQDPILDVEYIEKIVGYYVGTGSTTDPLISPLFADFVGFPPTMIQVGSNEILLSDSVSLAKKMQKDGVYVRMNIYNGMWHVFQMSPFKEATNAMDENVEFILSMLN